MLGMTKTEIARRMAENPDLYDETGFPIRGTVRIKFRECELVRLARERYPEFDFDQVLELEFPRKKLLTYDRLVRTIDRYLGEHLEVYIKDDHYWITWIIRVHYDVLNGDELEELFGDYPYEDPYED